MPKLIDLTGQRFGRWTVIERAPNKGKRTFWHCKCDCGNEKDVPSNALRYGESKSCGCYNNELCAKLGKAKFKDITGQRFGRLVAIRPYEEKTNKGGYQWLCECDCGRINIVPTYSLTGGNTQSCGYCSHASRGEIKIKELLESYNVYYEYQKTFESCRFPETNRLARFDFFIDNRYLLEFDGEQHFIDKSGIFRDSLKAVQYRDSFKNEWCKKNNIPLIRIPYTKLETLTFNDIWLPKDNDKNPQDCTIKSVFS